MTEVIMPKMGDGMEEGTLLEWLKKDGEFVKSGEVIGTIQTDKATLELEAPGKGSLTGFLIEPGTTVPVGVPIAAILKEGESLPSDWGKKGVATASAPAPVEAPSQANKVVTSEPPSRAEMPVATISAGRVKASPLAKKVAQELGVDISQVAGTGPGGRVVEQDVRSFKPSGNSSSKLSAPALQAVAAEDVKIPMSPLRKVIAERTTHSKQTIPHFYVTVKVDLSKIDNLRQSFKEEDGGKISVNDFIIRACVLALQGMPIVNSIFQGDHFLQKGNVSIGIAAAVEDGLLVPVIHGAHEMNLRQLSSESKKLVAKAREGRLYPDEMHGSTFSISNMGMLNVESFSAIINEPNVAIVAISTARKQVVVGDDDELEIRLCMNMTGSFDHRVVDGAVGAQFMNLVRDYLQNPTRLLS